MRADDPQTRGPRPVDDAEDLLAAYRENHALPDEVRARVRQRLLLAGVPPTQSPPETPREGARRRAAIDARWWIAAAAILVLAFAALVLLSEQSAGIVASRRGLDGAAYTADEGKGPRSAVGRAPPGVRPLPAAPTAEATPRTREESVPHGSPTPSRTVPAPPTSTSTSTQAKDTTKDTPSRTESAGAPTPSAGATPPESSGELDSHGASPTLALSAEKALLEEAWRALAAGDDQGARAALRRHRRDFAAGILRQERETLEVLLACTTGADGAAQRAARFRREHPQSPWMARLDAICPQP